MRFGQPLRSVLFNAERSRDLSTSNITAHMIWVPGHTAERQIEYAPCLFQILEHAHTIDEIGIFDGSRLLEKEVLFVLPVIGII